MNTHDCFRTKEGSHFTWKTEATNPIFHFLKKQTFTGREFEEFLLYINSKWLIIKIWCHWKIRKNFLNLSVDSAFLFKGTGTKSKKIVWWKVFKVSLITIQNNPYHNLKFMNIKQSSSKVTWTHKANLYLGLGLFSFENERSLFPICVWKKVQIKKLFEK